MKLACGVNTNATMFTPLKCTRTAKTGVTNYLRLKGLNSKKDRRPVSCTGKQADLGFITGIQIN